MTDVTGGARIATLRRAHGWTSEDLGRAAGLSATQVSEAENGSRKLDVSEVAVVADALGVPLGELVGLPPDEPPAQGQTLYGEDGEPLARVRLGVSMGWVEEFGDDDDLNLDA